MQTIPDPALALWLVLGGSCWVQLSLQARVLGLRARQAEPLGEAGVPQRRGSSPAGRIWPGVPMELLPRPTADGWMDTSSSHLSPGDAHTSSKQWGCKSWSWAPQCTLLLQLLSSLGSQEVTGGHWCKFTGLKFIPPVLSFILPPHPPPEELPFPLSSPWPSEGLLCCLQVWDVAKTPRRELTPRTGCESGIPASR